MSLVNDSLRELRRKADHFRLLSYGIGDERTRLILRDMASEYENRAAAAEAQSAPVQRVLVDHD